MHGMLGLMGLFGPRVDPKFAAAQAAARAAEHAERLVRYKEIAQPWTPGIKWEKDLVIRAATFPVLDLFPHTKSVAPEGMIHWPWDKLVAEGVASPTGEFVFIRRVLPAATHLATYLGRRVGTVGFDEDVCIPCLFQRSNWRFEKTPWMSITPSELLSLRPGTKKARGRVCVAGLGLGHQLVEVANKKTVTSIVLVERNQELVDWLLPQIRARILEGSSTYNASAEALKMVNKSARKREWIVYGESHRSYGRFDDFEKAMAHANELTKLYGRTFKVEEVL